MVRKLSISLVVIVVLVIGYFYRDQIVVFTYDTFQVLQEREKQIQSDSVLKSDILLVNEADSVQDTTIISNNDIIILNRRPRLDDELEESSGLLYAGDSSFWTQNDSKNKSNLYMFDIKGELIHTLYLKDTKNVDWEDLAKDSEGNIYVGDFGNNGNKRKSLYIYKIPNLETINSDTLAPEVIEFGYEDQEAFPPPDDAKNFDMEAMVVYNDTIFLFSKNRTRPYNGYSKRYWLPTKPGKYKAQLIDSVLLETDINFDIDGWVTGAAVSPNKKHLLLLSYRRLWIFSCFEGSNFFQGEVTKLNFSNFSQKEAIDFVNDNEVFITDERTAKILGGRLYSADLSQWLNPCNQTVKEMAAAGQKESQ